MPDTPIPDDARMDDVLRRAGARMRAASEVAPSAPRRPGRDPSARRWIVPVTIAVAAAAAVVAAVWITGPATETVREVPADTGSATVPVIAPNATEVAPPSEPDVTAQPVEGSAVSDPDLDPPVIQVTVADFDGAGGACLSLASSTRKADACIGHRQLEDTPTWTVALDDGAVWQVTVDAFDPAVTSLREVTDVCGRASSALIPSRWLHVACDDASFWFVAAPETPSGGATTFVTPPGSAVPAELVPLDSTLPDGFVAYRVDYPLSDTVYTCLVVGLFPDPWREACVDWSEQSMLLPIGGTVFVVDTAPNLESLEITDIATLSVPIVGCTAPIADLAAGIPEKGVMISGLICAGDWAMVDAPSAVLGSGPVDGSSFLLERATDGSWSTAGGGTSFPCDFEPHPACEVFGVDDDLASAPLPIPPWGLIGAREHDLDPVEITADVRSITGGARDANEIVSSVVRQYSDSDGSEGDYQVVDSLDPLGLVIVDIDALDDSITSERYVVWYRPADDGTLDVERAYRITACSRGLAAPDLCV